jgi:hypothetical protein
MLGITVRLVSREVGACRSTRVATGLNVSYQASKRGIGSDLERRVAEHVPYCENCHTRSYELSLTRGKRCRLLRHD